MPSYIAPAKIPIILAEYIESEVIPKTSGLRKAGAYAFIFAMNARFNSLMNNEEIVNMLKSNLIMNNEGLIDIDYLKEMGNFVISKANNIPVAGYLLDETDIEKIYAISKGMM